MCRHMLDVPAHAGWWRGISQTPFTLDATLSACDSLPRSAPMNGTPPALCVRMNERQEQGPQAASRPRLEWMVAPWLQPFWYAYLAHSWWHVAETTSAGRLTNGGALVAASKLAGSLTEAAFYVLWW